MNHTVKARNSMFGFIKILQSKPGGRAFLHTPPHEQCSRILLENRLVKVAAIILWEATWLTTWGVSSWEGSRIMNLSALICKFVIKAGSMALYWGRYFWRRGQSTVLGNAGYSFNKPNMVFMPSKFGWACPLSCGATQWETVDMGQLCLQFRETTTFAK